MKEDDPNQPTIGKFIDPLLDFSFKRIFGTEPNKDLFDIAEYSKLMREEKDMYDTSLKQKWDKKAILDYAKEEGREEERAKAYAEKLQSALKMKKSGFDHAMIADVLKLPIEEVEKL